MLYIAVHPQYAAINRPRRFAFGEDCSGRSLWPKREWSPDRCCCPHFRGPGIEGSAKSSLSRRSEEHTSELQSLMRISYAVFCLKKKKYQTKQHTSPPIITIQLVHHSHTLTESS